MTARDVFQIELRTRDLAKAVPFYKSVFDWKIYKASDDYALVDSGAMPIVGILQTSSPMFPVGAVANLLVPDCEAEAQRAVALGGRISVPTSEVPSSGRYIGVVDPWGTESYLWQPFTDQRPAPKGSGKNPVSYVEYAVPDLVAAQKYYAGLCDWSFWSIVFKDAFLMAEGCGLQRGVGLVSGRPGFLSYVDVESLEDTGAKIAQAGGTVLVPPTEFPGEGRYLIFADPDGVPMGAIDRGTPS